MHYVQLFLTELGTCILMTSNLETDTINDIEICYSKSELKLVMDGMT